MIGITKIYTKIPVKNFVKWYILVDELNIILAK